MAAKQAEQIFISYKRKDKERVFAIRDLIEERTGAKCWIDLDGVESNAQFVANIVRAIDKCDVFLFMRSKEHNKITDLETDWTIREVNYALEEHKNIVFVNLDNTPMPKWFKFMFPNKQHIDATDTESLHRLCNDLCGWLGTSPKEAKQPSNDKQTITIKSTPKEEQPTIIQTPEELEKAKRDALPNEPFQIGDLMYMASENGVVVHNCMNKYASETRIPSQIMYGKCTYEVTSIGDEAFSGCKSLSSITIPNSVTSIGQSAFFHCSGLTSITIPNSVASIGQSAFAGCESLTTIIVEQGNAKYDCRENCNAIIETATNTLISGCQNTIIPNSVRSIGDSAFFGCSSLTSITIPNSVTSIAFCAFSVCESLTSITIPNSVTEIGIMAFDGCKSLTSITIPNSVTSIGDSAFFGCSSLTSITIPNSVTSIGTYAFEGCSSLKSAILPNTLKDTRNDAFPKHTELIYKTKRWFGFMGKTKTIQNKY